MPPRRPDRVTGPNHDEFWAWCARRELRLQRCGDCHELSWPPVAHCEHCGGNQLSWSKMSGTGTIVSWCSFSQDYYHGAFPQPHDTILVGLDEGPLFMSNPQGFTVDEIEPSMLVSIDFVACKDSAGEFNLPVFRKV